MGNSITIPKYSLSEELINAILHGIGASLGITALVLCVVKSAIHTGAKAVVCSCIYGASLIVLYMMSTMYHSLKPNRAKKVFRVIDHCSIYFLIAGTYTPFTLVAIGGAWGWVLFGIVWGCTALGITLTAVNIQKFKVFSMIAYIAEGWVILIAFNQLLKAVEFGGVLLLLLGGVLYTVGAVLYGIGKKIKYFHSIFHMFVLAGSILHFFSIFFYVL
ncbi:MAG: hemolysin III family protein [Oscillospiraceae bacterium]|nr:hemolysin III family protein [Oscillospiraceae bacterium]